MTPGAWWCRLCGHAYRGGRSLLIDLKRHLELAHAYVAIEDRQN